MAIPRRSLSFRVLSLPCTMQLGLLPRSQGAVGPMVALIAGPKFGIATLHSQRWYEYHDELNTCRDAEDQLDVGVGARPSEWQCCSPEYTYCIWCFVALRSALYQDLQNRLYPFIRRFRFGIYIKRVTSSSISPSSKSLLFHYSSSGNQKKASQTL